MHRVTGAYSGISAPVTHFIKHNGIDYAPERARHATHVALLMSPAAHRSRTALASHLGQTSL